MATWVIGDVQGCCDALLRLIEAIAFDPLRDELWLAGDLVNRGPDSLGVLRWAVDCEHRHPGRVRAVLGNHDLHLLTRAEGLAGPKRRDTLDELLAAPDLAQLLQWLARQPLAAALAPVHGLPALLVHAGLLPHWPAPALLQQAQAISQVLTGPERPQLLRALLDGTVPVASDLRDMAEMMAVLTRLRCVRADGRPQFDFAGTPETAPRGCTPWYEVTGRRSSDHFVIFGHWAALGVRRGRNWASTDSGCVWGNTLSALRLHDLHVVDVPAGGDNFMGSLRPPKPAQ